MKRFWLRYRLAGVLCALVVLVASPAVFDLEARTAPVVGVAVEPDERVHDDPVELSWRALAALDYRTGEMSDELRDLVGKPVKIPGFTVPLEDFASSATEFLLVPYVGACVHTPPPPPNQLVYVEMDEGRRATMDGWNPVWLEGILHVEDVNSIYGSSSYRVVGMSVKPYG
tara:strand:- start:262 stop:774 length:513 start_codon:yes stop_codon:yes gene_type:complete